MESSRTRLDSVLFSANRYFSIAKGGPAKPPSSSLSRGNNFLIANFHAPDALQINYSHYRLIDRDDQK